MSAVTELTKYLRVVYDYNEETKQHVQTLIYQRKGVVDYDLNQPLGGVRVLLKAVSGMGVLPLTFLMTQAFTEHAFFVENDLIENENKPHLDPHQRMMVIRDLSEAIQCYQTWDVLKEHPKGNRDYLITHQHNNIDVLVVPYLIKVKLTNGEYDLHRKVMLKIKIKGTKDTIIHEFGIGRLFNKAKPVDYLRVVDEIVSKYHLNEIKETVHESV